MIACTNPECEQHGVEIDNPFGYDPAEIHCGTCGGPCFEGATEPES